MHNAAWFDLPGSDESTVSTYLAKNLATQKKRFQFLELLSEKLAADGESLKLDQLSALQRDVDRLRETIEDRLTGLDPKRPASWFRSTTNRPTGPLGSQIITDPIFPTYPEHQIFSLDESLTKSFTHRDLSFYPFSQGEPCIWLRLLKLAASLDKVAKFPHPFGMIRLDTPELKLPMDLECPHLRHFIQSVSGEVLQAKHQIEGAYEKLLGASRRLWHQQLQNLTRANQAHRTKKVNLSEKDIESLKVLGFRIELLSDLPSKEEVRLYYLNQAKIVHPDRMGGKDAQFKKLNEAYAYLRDRSPSVHV